MSSTAPTSSSTSSETALNQRALVLPAVGCCFHCGLALPKKPMHAYVLGQMRDMCCLGCALAAQSIVECGLEAYYLDRTEIAATAHIPLSEQELHAFDSDALQQQFIANPSTLQNATRQTMSYAAITQRQKMAQLSIAGIRCTACAWLIESRLKRMNGVAQVHVNVAQQQMTLVWDDTENSISRLIHAVDQLGYTARPFKPDTHQAMLLKQRRQYQLRLGVAALGSMQAMMFAASVYLGDYSGMDAGLKEYFRYLQLGLTLPVLVYGGDLFFKSAWAALKARYLNMDVPVALALLITFIYSVYTTLINQGETYYDAVSMFIFLLLIGRYLEVEARTAASQQGASLLTIEPLMVNVKRGQHIVSIAAVELQVGDEVVIAAGQSVPCDGELLVGEPMVSEALLTGEAIPVLKRQGDLIAGGSLNYGQPFTMRVHQTVQHSQQEVLEQLKQRALAERPRLAVLADRYSQWFVAFILGVSVLVWLLWQWFDPSKALHAMVAVLVATCPCALALATPMVLSHATHRLAAKNFLTTRGHVLEQLNKVSHIVFDKTGTLTEGSPRIVATHVYHDAVNLLLAGEEDNAEGSADVNAEAHVLRIAASMEQYSRHPIASAFLNAAQHLDLYALAQVENEQGLGLKANLNGVTYRLGNAQFTALPENMPTAHEADFWVYLVQEHMVHENAAPSTTVLAAFGLQDAIRPEAFLLLERLRTVRRGGAPQCILLSGDTAAHVRQVADALHIQHAFFNQKPEQKMHYIQQLQQQGAVVMMVGDGVNDGPVLGAADISVAMGGGADLAVIQSDSVLLHNDLMAIDEAFCLSQRAYQLIRQNLIFSMVYNVLIIIPAALGFISPWLATIGMSLSSLVVVLNARRV